VFRRRSSTEPTLPNPTSADPVDADGAPVKKDGKGRPTPKRRDAQPYRRPLGAPPKDRKEAVRAQRAEAKARRIAARDAMAAGDDKFLPARDKGPVRRYVRDFIDSRRSIGQYFLPLAFVIFLVSTFGARNPTVALVTSLAFYGMFLLIVVDSMILNRRLKSELRQHFPGENTRGITFYALMRGLQFRRMRFPKPQVRPGEPVVPAKR
jgi:hypothetical protein